MTSPVSPSHASSAKPRTLRLILASIIVIPTIVLALMLQYSAIAWFILLPWYLCAILAAMLVFTLYRGVVSIRSMEEHDKLIVTLRETIRNSKARNLAAKAERNP